MPSLLSPRVPPPGFAYVPGRIFECRAPGLAVHDIDLGTLFDSVFSSDLGSKEVFIDPGGSDANTGQFNLPLKTLAAAMAKPNVGRIWVKPGIYTERFDIRASQATVGGGLRARPIRIEAWGGQIQSYGALQAYSQRKWHGPQLECSFRQHPRVVSS